jgi:hypothetical protein
MSQPATAPRPGFGVPARFHLILLFMTQFIFFLAVFGGFVPTLHQQGTSLWLLVPGAIAVVLIFHFVLGVLGRLLPVRCRPCGAVSRFRGFGWWPFIYRYPCATCGQEMRLEVQG